MNGKNNRILRLRPSSYKVGKVDASRRAWERFLCWLYWTSTNERLDFSYTRLNPLKTKVDCYHHLYHCYLCDHTAIALGTLADIAVPTYAQNARHECCFAIIDRWARQQSHVDWILSRWTQSHQKKNGVVYRYHRPFAIHNGLDKRIPPSTAPSIQHVGCIRNRIPNQNTTGTVCFHEWFHNNDVAIVAISYSSSKSFSN